MASVVRMPSVLAGAEEAAISNWLVAPGDTVAVGDPLAEIETEKAIVEYGAEEAGVVGRLVLAVGDSGEIGAPIAVLVHEGETDADIDAALSGETAAAPAAPGPAATAIPPGASAPDPAAPAIPDAVSPSAPAPPAARPAASPVGATPVPAGPVPASPVPASPAAGPVGATPAALTGPPVPAAPAGPPVPAAHRAYESEPTQAATPVRIFASPLVRKIARQEGLDLAALSGSGPNGRIVRRDLERLAGQRQAAGEARNGAQVAAAQAAPQPAAAPQEPSQAPADTLIPHTPIRRAIARRLTESKTTTPHFYMTTECVVDELLTLRTRVNETGPVKVSVNDFVIMAVAAAFGDVPEANVTWSDEGLVAHASVDVSIAVATDGGLVTPVLRGVGAKRLSAIAAEAQSLVQRARDRRLLQHELEGGVFSISNLGMYGTLEFSAIINPPQSGILAVGAATPQAVVVDGAVTVATVMRCTLSVDHRAIDGALAAQWLAAFTARIQNPLGMII
ncbi:MAG TPA: dihydrolipoamide acetyltransferase family protein [Streptosporangiaceae bacterium]